MYKQNIVRTILSYISLTFHLISLIKFDDTLHSLSDI